MQAGREGKGQKRHPTYTAVGILKTCMEFDKFNSTFKHVHIDINLIRLIIPVHHIDL